MEDTIDFDALLTLFSTGGESHTTEIAGSMELCSSGSYSPRPLSALSSADESWALESSSPSSPDERTGNFIRLPGELDLSDDELLLDDDDASVQFSSRFSALSWTSSSSSSSSASSSSDDGGESGASPPEAGRPKVSASARHGRARGGIVGAAKGVVNSREDGKKTRSAGVVKLQKKKEDPPRRALRPRAKTSASTNTWFSSFYLYR